MSEAHLGSDRAEKVLHPRRRSFPCRRDARDGARASPGISATTKRPPDPVDIALGGRIPLARTWARTSLAERPGGKKRMSFVRAERGRAMVRAVPDPPEERADHTWGAVRHAELSSAASDPPQLDVLPDQTYVTAPHRASHGRLHQVPPNRRARLLHRRRRPSRARFERRRRAGCQAASRRHRRPGARQSESVLRHVVRSLRSAPLALRLGRGPLRARAALRPLGA